MAFQLEQVGLEMVAALQPVVARIKRRDRSLADQLTRAANSVVLNAAEANYSDPGNKTSRLFTAAGSASEVRAALKLSIAWRYCRPAEVEAAATLLDRIIAILWKLTHR